jgi:UDP-glucuronate 4-epimerase
MTVLLTGAAGFIGAYVARGLLARGDAVVGIDNFTITTNRSSSMTA